MADKGPSRSRRRTAERTAILGKLQGEVKVFQPIDIKEISPDGAQIETGFPFLLDSLHEFRLTIGSRAVVLQGRIVHCHVSEMDGDLVFYQSGVAFVDVPSRVKRAIADYIQRVKQARRPL